MDPLPTLTVIEQSEVSPPPATVGHRSLLLTFSDMTFLGVSRYPFPTHTLYFYDLPAVTKTHFTQTILPNLKQSLSVTLQHFFPFAGKLIIFPTQIPEIRYTEGDSVTVTFAECNLDFHDLVGNHPREAGKFYHLIPVLGRTAKVLDHVTIPVFAVQVTLFPNHGMCIGITNHHSLGDASTRFCFLKAWTSIARSGGSDESFLANGTLPVYDRLLKYPKLDEIYLKKAKLETYNEEYELPRLCEPTDKVRATFVLARTVISGLKALVLTQLPTLAYVSSFTVTCAYIWNCMAASLRNDELVLFGFPVNCRSRIDPPIPAAYFGNCLNMCFILARTCTIKGKEGFLNAAKLIGENLHNKLTDKDGVVEDQSEGMVHPGERPTKVIVISGTPKLNFYELDFGFGMLRKHERVSIDYSGSVSIDVGRESGDLEIGVCLSPSDMDVFVGNFNSGLELYI